MADGSSRPPPRPVWLKVSVIVAIMIVAVVVVIAIAGGGHGPARHQGGGVMQGHTPAVERSL